ncbi:hypothetical protein SORBI_3008G060400 [Sorghum bicolor]|uniref:Uncharacterized protein n=1 Tax=Sorghum bicolor TaxID=4558 RepID=A0A1B6PBI4_SORBI|nr:hypothetical protein SORBI_3008G060400 [Sorghum bicolor]
MLRVCSLATRSRTEEAFGWPSTRTAELVTPCALSVVRCQKQRKLLNVVPCVFHYAKLRIRPHFSLEQDQVIIRLTALVLPSTFDVTGSTGRSIFCLQYGYS